jgi:hypothetical protein
LRDREPPLAPPKLPDAYIFEVTEEGAEIGTNVYGNYG